MVFIFISIVKDLLGVGVELTGKASQYVQVPTERGKWKNKHMECAAARVGGSSESIWKESYHWADGKSHFSYPIVQPLIPYF